MDRRQTAQTSLTVEKNSHQRSISERSMQISTSEQWELNSIQAEEKQNPKSIFKKNAPRVGKYRVSASAGGYGCVWCFFARTSLASSFWLSKVWSIQEIGSPVRAIRLVAPKGEYHRRGASILAAT